MIIVGADTTEVVEDVIVPVRVPRLTLGLFLTGVDGSLWDMYDGPVRVQSGLRFGVADPTHWKSTAPAVPGSRWLGMHVEDADPMWPVRVVDTGESLTFRDMDAAFKAAVGHGEAETVHTVVTPDGLSRSRNARYVSGFNADRDVDPLLQRHAAYGLQFDAVQPFWAAATIVTTFSVADPPDFIDSPFDGYYLAPSHTAATATVSNPGDVDAYPKWTVTGPFTEFTVGVGSSLVTYVLDTALGDSVIIDMDPRAQTVADQNGTDLRRYLTERKFVPIPHGTDVSLTIDVTGSDDGTSVSLEVTPLFWEPW